MHYFASLNPNKVCMSIMEIDDQTYNENVAEGYTYEDEYCIALETNDTSLIYKKKYVNGEWVDCLPSETGLLSDKDLLHLNGSDDMFLFEAIGRLSTLLTDEKTSLVGAVNECFQSASDGKTAIANAITGVDESITIPTNPTFAQLATCISQISTGMQVAVGSMNEYTIPSTIEGTTPFKPKIVIVYNFGTGLSNFNMGVYVSPDITGVTTQQITDSANGIGNTLSRRANSFTITDTGFSMINSGAATDLKWIALG